MVSKGYVLIGEQLDGSVTELESRDLNFFESEFPNKGEVEKTWLFMKWWIKREVLQVD